MNQNQVWNGLPVPYVAMWSGERVPSAYSDMQWWQGIHWMRQNRPHGVPYFGMTNSFRQRECMRRRRCQVCGDKGADTWVVPNDAKHVELWNIARLILNPPLHAACLELARGVCPHLQAVEPFMVRHHPATADVEFVACSADSADGTTSYALITLEQARAEGWIGRELIVELPEEA